MVHIPKNPCPAVTDAAVNFLCTAGSYVKWGVVTVATSETTKKVIRSAGECLSSLYQQVRHSSCVEKCTQRFSRTVTADAQPPEPAASTEKKEA